MIWAIINILKLHDKDKHKNKNCPKSQLFFCRICTDSQLLNQEFPKFAQNLNIFFAEFAQILKFWGILIFQL